MNALNATLVEVSTKLGDGGSAIFGLLREKYQAQSLRDIDAARYPELQQDVLALVAG